MMGKETGCLSEDAKVVAALYSYEIRLMVVASWSLYFYCN
jgi:hypothetical protein